MKPHLRKRGNTWYCETPGRYSYADSFALAYWNFVYTHGLR